MDSVIGERERLRAQGRRAGKSLSINWSLWAGGGMKVDEQIELFLRKTSGIRALSAETGIEALLGGLAGERSQFAALEGIQEKVELSWGLRKKEDVARKEDVTGATAGNKKDDGLEAALEHELSEIAQEMLKLAADDIASDKILLDLGFDSIGLTTYANAINDRYQLDITPVLFFDYPTIGEITKYLCAERREEITRSRSHGARAQRRRATVARR
jgi:acyl carrier protein